MRTRIRRLRSVPGGGGGRLSVEAGEDRREPGVRVVAAVGGGRDRHVEGRVRVAAPVILLLPVVSGLGKISRALLAQIDGCLQGERWGAGEGKVLQVAYSRL